MITNTNVFKNAKLSEKMTKIYRKFKQSDNLERFPVYKPEKIVYSHAIKCEREENGYESG